MVRGARLGGSDGFGEIAVQPGKGFAIPLERSTVPVGVTTPELLQLVRGLVKWLLDDADVSSIPHHSVRRVFPSTAGRWAFQTVPSQSVVGLSLLRAYTNQHLVCFRPWCISGALRFSRTVPGRGPDHAPPSWVGYPPPKGPSRGSRLFCPGPSSLNRPHPPHTQAHQDFTARRLIRAVFAVWERLGDPRVVQGFRCSFRPDMPSSPRTPGKIGERGVFVEARSLW
jgi:hypothetical protein